jgi:AraC family transcriptional activator FtrA
MKKHLVVALAYDRLCTFEFGCTVELFALERPELEVDWYDFAVCAIEDGPIRAGGIMVQAPYQPELLAQADTIVIPGWRDADEVPPAALLEQIRAAHQRGARLCSLFRRVRAGSGGVLDASPPPPTGAMRPSWRGAIRRYRCSPMICMWITAS